MLISGQDERFPLIFWQSGNGGLDRCHFFFGSCFVVRVCRTVGRALLGEVGRVGEGLWVAGRPAVVVAREVGGDGEDPGGERLARIVAGAVPVKADEGLLSEVAGGGIIRAHADDEADEAVLPAAHEGVHGGIVAIEQIGHVELIFVFVFVLLDGSGGLHWVGRSGLPGAAGFA